jgi:AraC-like DNA-binding protein
VNLTPVGARLVFGIPLEALTRRVVALPDFFGAEGRRLEEQLGSDRSWEARFSRLESWLLARVDRAVPAGAAVDWLWQQLALSRGRASIGALGQALGWSRERMVTTARRELGMAPKLLARVVRFHTMTRCLRAGRSRSWSALAHECGYHDQSHLIRETRAFAGCTPIELPGHLLQLPS